MAVVALRVGKAHEHLDVAASHLGHAKSPQLLRRRVEALRTIERTVSKSACALVSSDGDCWCAHVRTCK